MEDTFVSCYNLRKKNLRDRRPKYLRNHDMNGWPQKFVLLFCLSRM